MTDRKPEQTALNLTCSPKPTGDLWEPSKTHPASVPVPLPVVMVRVEGPFTALDRKLWLLLLHNAWDELNTDVEYHTISVAKLLRLFRQYGRGDLGKRGVLRLGKVEEETDAAELWNSIRRLVKTSIEWDDGEYQGISSLIGDALISKKHRITGNINYNFGKLLSKQLLLPRAFARLRCHVILALKSKYAVTLYEILEAYVNRRESGVTVPIADLKTWLKVPENAESYNTWPEFQRRVLRPAVDEINANSGEGGFTVSYEGIREGKAFARVKFTVEKTEARENRDFALVKKATRARAFKAPAVPASGAPYTPTEAVYTQLNTIAAGRDKQFLIASFNDWSKGKPPAKNPHGAFLGWVKKYVKEHPI